MGNVRISVSYLVEALTVIAANPVGKVAMMKLWERWKEIFITTKKQKMIKRIFIVWAIAAFALMILIICYGIGAIIMKIGLRITFKEVYELNHGLLPKIGTSLVGLGVAIIIMAFASLLIRTWSYIKTGKF